MARGKRPKGKSFKKPKEVEGKAKEEPARNDNAKKTEEKTSNRPSSCFRSEEIQEIRQLMNFDELNQEHCFLGAVVIGKFDVVKKMLKEGYNIDSLDENRETALMHTIKHFRPDMVDFLVTRGADISLVDGEGNNALQLAAQSPLWDQDSFCGLWQSASENPRLRLDHSNKTGYCLLHFVTQRQWLSVLEQLLTHPLRVDCRTDKGVTPLIMAASRGDSCSIQALLEAGADVTLEDHQRCTALCYAIADRLQKNVGESDRALELLLAALNDEQSKTNLELYLERRLLLILSPPKSKAEFAKTVSSVIGQVLTFFARFIYSGVELLLDLRLFHKLAESLALHIDDSVYTTVVLTIVSELVRHCDCCCQGLSQVELADAFFYADLGKILLEILNRYGTGKTEMIKAVFLPLLMTCTSDSYMARVWLERYHVALQTFYNKYTRSFPAIFMDACGDKHLQTEKQRALSFQGIMKTLKTNGRIVTKEEHAKASQKLKEEKTMAHVANMFKILPDSKLNASSTKQNKSKTSAVYNSIVQYNFGKLDIIQSRKESLKSPKEPQKSTKNMKKESTPAEEISEQPRTVVIPEPLRAEQTPRKDKISIIAIKEIQQKQVNEMDRNTTLINNERTDKCMLRDALNPQTTNSPGTDRNEDVKVKFFKGYELFKMEETSSSEDESPSACEWLDTYAVGDGNKVVTDAQVVSTLTDLEEIFNRIVKRYNSTWLRQYEEGYLGAQGDSDDLLMLMKVLPALEEFHMRKLMEKWSKFCKQIQDYARKNHIIYAATVSEMQLFLLDFESELDKKNYKIFEENDRLKTSSCLFPEGINQNSNTKHSETPTSVSTKKMTSHENSCVLNKNINVNLSINQNEKTESTSILSLGESTGFGKNVYISEPGNEHSSIWDVKVKQFDSDKHHIIDNIDVVNIQEESSSNSSSSSNETEIIAVKNKEETDLSLNLELDCLLANTDKKVQNELSQDKKTKCLNITGIQDTLRISCKNSNPGSVENIQVPEPLEVENKSVIRECVKATLKPPPGYDYVIPAKSNINDLISAPNYSGTKYQSLSLSLATLPSHQTELLADGHLKLASVDFQLDFKLFTGFNFGDVELGLNSVGVPLAVRRFQKVRTQCNKLICEGLVKSVVGMLHLSHPHILPYLACYDLSHSVVYAVPLCYHDLGQHIRQLRSSLTSKINCFTQLTPHLLNLAKQLMLGLHYLHTRDKVIIHGNLKPSNVMVDTSGTLRLSEFGLHEIVFQQRTPAMTSFIWWSRESALSFSDNCNFICTKQSDMQTAGMLVHFVLTLGHHPFGQSLLNITKNIKIGVIQPRCMDVIAIDLIYWQLSSDPRHRPTTHDTLRHVMFWSSEKRWRFLQACCGLGPHHPQYLDIELLYRDLDLVGELRDVNTKWITIMKENCKSNIGTNGFEDKPSGLLRFLQQNLTTWAGIKDIFLELFPVLPLNLFRLLEQTEWIHHPQFEPYIRLLT